MEHIEEYDKICKRAAKIQERLAMIFQLTQRKHQEMIDIKCNTCFAQFGDEKSLNEHECIIDEENLEKVGSNDDDENVEAEYLIEFDGDEQTLEVDDDHFENKTEVEKKEKAEKMKYTCTVCNQQFNKRSEFNKHSKFSHLPNGSEVYQCGEKSCLNSEEIYTSELEFELHMVLKHPKDNSGILKCPAKDCMKVFEKKVLLTRHFGLHLKNKPLVCFLCGKKYYHTSSFSMHMKIHSGKKKFECSYCDKKFISSSHLNRHLKVHTKEKNYECSECGLKFALRYNLNAHFKTHYGFVRKRKVKDETATTL
jgi:transcription elongation factor Elf1